MDEACELVVKSCIVTRAVAAAIVHLDVGSQVCEDWRTVSVALLALQISIHLNLLATEDPGKELVHHPFESVTVDCHLLIEIFVDKLQFHPRI